MWWFVKSDFTSPLGPSSRMTFSSRLSVVITPLIVDTYFRDSARKTLGPRSDAPKPRYKEKKIWPVRFF